MEALKDKKYILEHLLLRPQKVTKYTAVHQLNVLFIGEFVPSYKMLNRRSNVLSNGLACHIRMHSRYEPT